MKKKSKSVIRLKYIELIAFMETWLAGLCFVVGIKWLIGLSIALFAIPLWGLISHRRWCRAHNEPYANWELFYTVIAWIVYIFILRNATVHNRGRKDMSDINRLM